MNKIILHIPHSSLKLPLIFKNQRFHISKNDLNTFNNTMTDKFVDRLFRSFFHTSVKAKYSRIFCDMEKYEDDEKELMNKFGMGVIYTKTNLGQKFYLPTKEYKNEIIKNYYYPYHNKLNKTVSYYVNKSEKVILLDCHSFSEDIIMFKEKKYNIPDICIGFNNERDEIVAKKIGDFFTNNKYVVQYNYPYYGSMLPNIYFDKQPRNLICIMIEINKKCYLYNKNKYNQLKTIIKQLMKTLLYV